MSDDLEFRAWDLIGQLTYSSEFDSLSEYFRKCEEDGLKGHEQFIKMLDANGKHAFEGDLYLDESWSIQVIGFDDDIDTDRSQERASGWVVSFPQKGRFIIIGNIHENPDLWEVTYEF